MASHGIKNSYDFDVIIVGGGHAGVEAAYAAARLGSKTVLISLDVTKIAQMPCNPSIGGVGKGHIVYEIAALGGLMPQLCTKTYLQARMLNTKKGPAVQGLRLQIDKYAYAQTAQQILAQTNNLSIIEGSVASLLFDTTNTNLQGVILESGKEITAPSIVITAGTFLNGLIHVGALNYTAGRRGERAVTTLSPMLASKNIQIGRLKTGTPPRLLKSSLNFDVMEIQEADNLPYLFEFSHHQVVNSHDCYITHTNEQTHTIIRENLDKSALFGGRIKGVGPRYCPSIEDKIYRFADKTSHHIFVEPEGAHVEEVYPSGLSTSLPYEVQKQYIQSIKGFEDAIITKPGYAVEYDFVFPNQLTPTLECKVVPGLFLAGQINGTTGYEEAAGQGIIAGINAHLRTAGKEPFVLSRHESYIGVMIDDLTTLSVDEPYRMFTSRAEHRLLLRQDNVFIRLLPKAYQLGLIDEATFTQFTNEKLLIDEALAVLQQTKNNQLKMMFLEEEYNRFDLKQKINSNLSDRAIDIIRAELMYAPYIIREQEEVKRLAQNHALPISHEVLQSLIDMPGLSKELQQKLLRHQPKTLGQANIIPGMTPAALSLLLFKIKMEQQTTRNKMHEQ